MPILNLQKFCINVMKYVCHVFQFTELVKNSHPHLIISSIQSYSTEFPENVLHHDIQYSTMLQDCIHIAHPDCQVSKTGTKYLVRCLVLFKKEIQIYELYKKNLL